MKYSGYMLNGRRWIPSLALLSASIGFGYLGSVLYTAQTRGGSSPFGPAANFNHAASIELILIGLLYVLLYERKENFGNLGLGFGRKDWIQTLYLSRA